MPAPRAAAAQLGNSWACIIYSHAAKRQLQAPDTVVAGAAEEGGTAEVIGV